MRRIDEHYLKTPWYGSRPMTVCLGQHGFEGCCGAKGLL